QTREARCEPNDAASEHQIRVTARDTRHHGVSSDLVGYCREIVLLHAPTDQRAGNRVQREIRRCAGWMGRTCATLVHRLPDQLGSLTKIIDFREQPDT